MRTPWCAALWSVLIVAPFGCQAPDPSPRIFVASSAHPFIEHVFPDALIVSGPSHILRAQLEHGARADLFISAHPDHTLAVSHLDAWSSPTDVMRAQVVAVTSDPALIHVNDLSEAPGLILAHPDVPLGHYTQALLAQQGEQRARRTWARARSLETQAAHVRIKLSSGAASASVIYRADLRALPGWRVLDAPVQVYARYSAVAQGARGARLLKRVLAHDPAAWGFEPLEGTP